MESTRHVGIAIVVIVIGAALYFFSFSGQIVIDEPLPSTTSTTTIPDQTAHTVSFRVLDTGTHAAGISTQQNQAVYSQADFVKLWSTSHGPGAVVKIDFSKEYVIGVFAGQRPTGGYSVAVTSVTDTGKVRIVEVTLTKPGAGCMVTEALTNPYQIIAVPVSSATLKHTDKEVSTVCN